MSKITIANIDKANVTTPSSGRVVIFADSSNNNNLSVKYSDDTVVGLSENVVLTGGTYSGDTITLNNSDGSLVTVTGVTSGGGSTNGTYYEYVQANGTDVENAAELQAAYTTAKSKVVTEETTISLVSSFGFDVFSGNLFAFLDEPSLAGVSLVNGQTYTIILDGVEYTGVVDFYGDSDIFMSSVTAPDGSYSTMSIVVSTTKRTSVVVAPGYYNFATDFIADDGNVDIVSLDGNRSVIFNGDGTINVTGDGAYIKGIDVQSKNFTIADDLPNITIVNCKGGEFSFGGDSTYGSNPITVSGTFIDCESGRYGYGSYGIASGYFKNCISTEYSFGGNGTVNGTFINCIDGSGGFSGISTGFFENCKVLGMVGFGRTICSGTFTNCEAGDISYGGNIGAVSGVFNNCISGDRSYGGIIPALGGTFTGKLYYCRITTPSGVFPTVSGGGITRYCIDGNDAPNNQG